MLALGIDEQSRNTLWHLESFSKDKWHWSLAVAAVRISDTQPAHFDEYILRRFFAGYGEGIVNLFADEGCKVVIADINEANGQR